MFFPLSSPPPFSLIYPRNRRGGRETERGSTEGGALELFHSLGAHHWKGMKDERGAFHFVIDSLKRGSFIFSPEGENAAPRKGSKPTHKCFISIPIFTCC